MQFNEIKSDIRKTWILIKSIISGKNKIEDEVKELHDDRKVLTEPVPIANAFNNYFINIGPNLARKITNPSGSHRDYVQVPNICCSSMTVLETDYIEIYNIVSALDPNTSCGYDEISPKVIKSVIGHILSPLVAIFNNSLQTGVLPNQLKIANVRPIYKSDDKFALNNYRPISVLPVLSKILEKLMYKRLLD